MKTRGLEREDSAAYGPGLLGGLKSEFIRQVLHSAAQRKWHPLADRYLSELHRYEYVSLETMETIQWSRVKAIVQHAALWVPYYRNLFREHGFAPAEIHSPRDFARLPTLTKAILQQKRDELIAENYDHNEGLPNASGGSTGKPVQFYQDNEYWNRAYASQWFVESWWGIRPGDRTASFWGADRDISDQSWKERLRSAIVQTRVCNAFALTMPQMELFAKMMSCWQPRYVIGYASALELFARFLLDQKDVRVRPHAIKATADTLSDEQRGTIEKAFRCPVYNFYGSREVNNLAAECQEHNGLHVNALTRYIEIVDDDGNAVPPGVPGRILVTDLTNYFMPFLRYEIEDIGSWREEPCECGRPFPLLERIWGRMSDFILTPDGKIVHGEFFTHLFYDLSEVALFQVEQKALRQLHISMTLRPGAKVDPTDRLRTRLRNAFGLEMNFDIQKVEAIQRPPSGKHRFTISSIRPSWGQSSQPDSQSRGIVLK